MNDDRPVTQGDVTRWLGWASLILLVVFGGGWLVYEWLTS